MGVCVLRRGGDDRVELFLVVVVFELSGEAAMREGAIELVGGALLAGFEGALPKLRGAGS